ncbi:DUF485 domain-containing protein [Streptomyces sp. NBC_01190]|uniref:DUF485 domain-containing protein n=1 Tax=Streptomyces sp. NBC_01190 TaxID=2903767 RepID=UPI0038682435|nr:DUF485 domain-containing protein [Streptomyces sp. NBC_01190]
MDKRDGGDPAMLRVDDPWQEAGAAAGLWLPEQQQAPEWAAGARPEHSGTAAVGDRAAVYLEVQHSEEFQEVRDRYRRFVFPVAAGFVSWYLLYVVAATTAPRLMAHRLAGELNVALAAGLAQFASTFLLTWAYARHARLNRDRAALDLRWTLATRTGQERVR